MFNRIYKYEADVGVMSFISFTVGSWRTHKRRDYPDDTESSRIETDRNRMRKATETEIGKEETEEWVVT